MPCAPMETFESLRAERDALRERLAEDQEVFAAIRSGKVDVVLAAGDGGRRIATFDEASESYRLLIENIEQGAATLSIDGTVLYANHRLAAMFGIPLEKLIGSSLFQHIPRDYHRSMESWLGGLDGEKNSGEWRLPSADFGEAVLHAAISPLPARSGSAYSLIVTDIGPTLEREELRRSKIHLEREAIELTAAKHAAEQASRAKSIFLANMSHELRTPLNAIIGFTEFLLMSEKIPERREQLNIVRDASGGLLQIIHNILDLSRIEAGQMRIDEEDFILEDIVNSVWLMFGAQATGKNIEFSATIDSQIPLIIRSDPGLLKQILVNLIGNAIKFTNNGRIDVNIEIVSTAPLRVIFHISDTGIGIKPQNLDRIFEMFEQEDSSFTKRFGGSGLGLSISKRLVSLLGGEIWVESKLGAGSRFSFTATFQAAHTARPDAPVAPTIRTPGKNPRVNILVVEDDLFSRTLLGTVLSDNGYGVVSVEDGDKAVEVMERQQFAMILMDIQLPLVSGLEIAKSIRSGAVRGCDSNIPIIAITAYAMRGDRERFLNEGMTDYVSKPINVAHLLATIARHRGAVPT